MPRRNLLLLSIVAALSYVCYLAAEQNPYARYAARGLADVEAGALESIRSQQLFDAAMNAMINVLHEHGDEHSQFITRDETAPFRAEIEQQFGGIGVRIRFVDDPPRLVVVGAPEPDSPAARAGIRADDHILEIDDEPTAGMTMPEVMHAMRGPPGTSIRLLVRHADSEPPHALTLVREVITVASILGDRRNEDGSWEYRLVSDPRIALIRVTMFANRTAQELATTLTRLTSDGVEAVVLDLRDDAGGALDAAVAVCDMLLPEGLAIVEIRGRDGALQDRYEASGKGPFRDLPLAVLVNDSSASASEIVAACLQDHGRAIVVGERSFGKGTVQKLIPTESGRSLLKLTSASYWRPSGRDIHRMPDAADSDDWGVSPDPGFEVPYSDEEYEAFREYRNNRDLIGIDSVNGEAEQSTTGDSAVEFVDRQLETAVKYLQMMLDD
jgi:carboxyl-terminal processing protease